MSIIRPRQTLFIVFVCLVCESSALKCRTGEETQPNDDFEYVVRMCLRQMKNNSTHHDNFERNFQSMFDSDKGWNRMQNKNGNNKGYQNRNQGDGDGFEYFWSPNNGRDKDREQKGDGDRKMDGDYVDESQSDFFHPRGDAGGRTRVRPRPPHTFQQQVQHDRDSSYGYGHRDSPFNYQSSERNKNSKRTSNRDRNGDSPLEQLDPCMIHCIFQEMQMLDENGKPDKGVVSEKMSQKIRNPELKSFIQDSVEECFETVDEESNNSNRAGGRGPDFMCIWAKNFAICLEEKGKESCDDWNDPLHRSGNNAGSKGRDDQKNKNKNSKGSNSSGNTSRG